MLQDSADLAIDTKAGLSQKEILKMERVRRRIDKVVQSKKRLSK